MEMTESKDRKARLTGTKEDSLRLRRLRNFTSHGVGRHPVLAGVKIKNGSVWASDGVRLAAIPAPEDWPEDVERPVSIDGLHAGDFILEADEITGTFPEVGEVMPYKPDREPAAVTSINGKFLREIGELAGDQPVTIILYDRSTDEALPIEFATSGSPNPSDDPTRLYACVMPMRIEGMSGVDPSERVRAVAAKVYRPAWEPVEDEPEDDADESEVGDGNE